MGEALSFGQLLRKRRLQAGLSQAALAGDDLHASYVSLLESDRRQPTMAALAVLADRLGVSPDELLADDHANLSETLFLAEASLIGGRTTEAVGLLAPFVTDVGDRRIVIDAEAYRATELYATALERSGQLEQATATWERLRTIAEAEPGRLPWLPTVMSLVRCYRDAGDLGRAVDLGESALKRFRELGLDGLDGHAALVSTLAGAYSERGDHLRAKTLLDRLIVDSDATGSLDDRGYAYWNAAINAAERGEVAEGRRLAERAAALLAEGEDARSTARLSVTRAWLLLAEEPPDAEQARALLRAAMPRLRESAGVVSLASAETELARCELYLGRPEVACRLARSAVERLSPEHRVERARALTVLGGALIGSGDTNLGLVELESAAVELEQVTAQRQAAAVWRQLVGVYRFLGDSDSALRAAERALDAAGLMAESFLPMSAPNMSAQNTLSQISLPQDPRPAR